MASLNPVDLLGGDDSKDPNQLIDKVAPLIASASSGGAKKGAAQTQVQKHPKTTSARLPPKPSPPSQPGLWDRFPTAITVQQMMETMARLVEDPFAYSSETEYKMRFDRPGITKKDVEAWIDNPFGYSREGSASLMAFQNTSAGGYCRGRTPWEIKEIETEYKMRFDMPGMTKEDVKVWVEDKILFLRGEKKTKIKEEEEEEGDWSAKSYGRYSCRISLPENVQVEKIEVEVRDGVLYITIPKAEVNKVFYIKVE